MADTGIVIAVCTSPAKGTAKSEVDRALLVENHGIEGDAHTGDWHRQISLLSFDKVEQFRLRGGQVRNGDFGENLLVRGIDFARLLVGTLLTCGRVSLVITQIGKECHSHCAIYRQVGDCIMPREGVFARVLQGGEIGKGDIVHVENALSGGGADGQ